MRRDFYISRKTKLSWKETYYFFTITSQSCYKKGCKLIKERPDQNNILLKTTNREGSVLTLLKRSFFTHEFFNSTSSFREKIIYDKNFVNLHYVLTLAPVSVLKPDLSRFWTLQKHPVLKLTDFKHFRAIRDHFIWKQDRF